MSTHDSSHNDAADLIDWYRSMGVDIALEEEPIDRTRPPDPVHKTIPERPEPGGPNPPRSDAQPAPTNAAQSARDIAAAAADLPALRAALDSFEGCNLRLTAKQLVFSDGNPDGKVMLVGEGPGREEDIQGLPFVGRSGQLLDRMLAAVGLDRTQVYIANIVPWRPPGNRRPTPEETAICRPFIERQIQLAAPEILILLGGAAAAELLSSSDGILKLRGRWHEFASEGRSIRTMPTLHPAYLLRQPLHKRLAWRDFLSVREALDAV